MRKLINILFLIFLTILLVQLPLDCFLYEATGDNSVVHIVNKTTRSAKATRATIATNNQDNSILWSFSTGLFGAITTQVINSDLNNDGTDDSIIFGTTIGLNIINISTGELQNYFKTKSQVTSVSVIPDISGDGYKDIEMISGIRS